MKKMTALLFCVAVAVSACSSGSSSDDAGPAPTDGATTAAAASDAESHDATDGPDEATSVRLDAEELAGLLPDESDMPDGFTETDEPGFLFLTADGLDAYTSACDAYAEVYDTGPAPDEQHVSFVGDGGTEISVTLAPDIGVYADDDDVADLVSEIRDCPEVSTTWADGSSTTDVQMHSRWHEGNTASAILEQHHVQTGDMPTDRLMMGYRLTTAVGDVLLRVQTNDGLVDGKVTTMDGEFADELTIELIERIEAARAG